MNNQNTATAIENINVKNGIEDLILVLNEKEKTILTKRFSLDNKSKETLEKIGGRFGITRERVRQIEYNAIGKLKRVVKSSKLNDLNKRAEEIILSEGGIVLEDVLISALLRELKDNKDVDGHGIKLSLNVNSEISSNTRGSDLKKFWKFNEVKDQDITKINNSGYNLLKKSGDLISSEELSSSIISMDLFNNRKPTAKFILSCLSLDNRVSEEKGDFGLMEWGFVNPKSIKDKAKIVLKKHGSPMYFIEIGTAIAKIGFNKKTVTDQAVHNELIKYKDFVLMGRGLYGLKEWGLISGSVSDVIEAILDKNGEPMKKRDIIDEVLKLREVKIGTISLNLQKNEKFIRFGRAVYGTAKMSD